MHSLDPNPFLTPTHSWSISKSPHNFHSLFLKNTHTHTQYKLPTQIHMHSHTHTQTPSTVTPSHPHTQKPPYTHTHLLSPTRVLCSMYMACVHYSVRNLQEVPTLKKLIFLSNQPLSANSFSNKKWGLEIHPSSAPTLEYGLD